ncbi:hypothetical protein UlMin_010224 [Ulmus minor]
MTLMSMEESQEEEHSKLFFQLLLDLLSFSTASFSALARYPVSVDELSINVIEKFITEQLNLTKDSISEIKKIHSHGSEVLKVANMAIDAVIKLCGAYAQAIDWKSYEEKLEKEKNSMNCEGVNDTNHVINITKCTIEKLCEMGIIAANSGGSLVSILNVSWKGVVTLLQHGNGVLAMKMNVADIILTLTSLVSESLKCAAETWSSPLKETVSVTEARRTFLPVKFYLINAVKISSLYPYQASMVHRELALCILMISTFRVSMSNEKLLKTASEVFTELLEKTSFDLLNSLLISDQVKQNMKFEVLDCLFSSESFASSLPAMDGIFSVICQAFSGARSELLGRVAMFLTLLRHSPDLEEDMKLGITRKLDWFLDILIDDEVYSSVLVLQVPVSYGSGKTVELVWKPIFSSLLDALKTFMVGVSSSDAWMEVECFLLENLFHPHFLRWEIVMELWCFIFRYAELEMVCEIVNKLCSLLKLMESSKSALLPCSAMRKLARSISMLISFGTQSLANEVFKSIVGDDGSQFSSVLCLALFMEGFPLNLLSEKMRSIARHKILTDYFKFIESFKEISSKTCINSVFGAPVFVLSSSLQSLQFSLSDIDVKTLRFLVSVIHNYRTTVDKPKKDLYCKLLSETLCIVSNMKHLYAYDEMEEVIFELGKLFISGPAASDAELNECKPNLALFIAGLAHMKLPESKMSSKLSAAWELYHMMLKERHWALIHLALTAFGYFSSRTSCEELWRFVPHDSALSYDLISGNEVNEETFMTEFKAFLDKETALDSNASSSEQLCLLAKEGLILKEMVQKISTINVEDMPCRSMEIDDDKKSVEVDCENAEKQSNKRRKLPNGISNGVELLQNGMKAVVDGLSQWQRNQPESAELYNKFLTHVSRLGDEITRLVGLAGDN